MALQDYLDIKEDATKVEITENRIMGLLDYGENFISFWREYPDYLIDFLAQGSNFKLYDFQRIMLRACLRYKYTFFTFTRAYSKSFIIFLAAMAKCILYPGAKLFIASDTKEQAAKIAEDKAKELIELLPGLKNELDMRPGKTTFSKDSAQLTFKNGSILSVVAVKDSTRGMRRHGGIFEEVILMDGELINSVVLPLMNVSRPLPNGLRSSEDSPLNKSQMYVTTAGWKNTFSYDKLLQLLLWQVLYKDKAFVLGGTWRIPVLEKLLDKGFVNDLKADGTYSEDTFLREYESVWAGASADAFFNSAVFDHNRTIQKPEYSYSGNTSKTGYYILGIDVGRKHDSSEIVVIKVLPQGQSEALKNVVNIYSYDQTHLEDLAIEAKRIFLRFKAKVMVVDGNGVGLGFVDYLVKDQLDPDTNELLPGLGVINDDQNIYKRFKTENTLVNTLYTIKATAQLNTEMHSYINTQMRLNKVKFLVDEKTAKNRLLAQVQGQKMTPEERSVKLRPYVLTSILREQMLNLREENEGVNIILKRVNNKIKKDKFSALEMGLWYIKLEEDKRRKKKKMDLKKLSFFN